MSISPAMGSPIVMLLNLFVIFPMIGFLVAGLVISIVKRKKAGIIVFSVLNGLLYLAVQVTAIIIIIIGAMS
ncbi:MAG: hypothetical protein MJ184_03030 [Treponema sp.]|uniref:hypothetical protein n=1 Tax=Treponema sp. TaxID=166 RepID=UPI00298D94E9|nr:hypothetical protein [Treponema sp.]MCQ2600315.1 hypothetical protein [Treponema sp.]